MKFSQGNEVIHGLDGRMVARIACYNCNKLRNFANFCPDAVDGRDLYHMNSMWLPNDNSNRAVDNKSKDTKGTMNHVVSTG